MHILNHHHHYSSSIIITLPLSVASPCILSRLSEALPRPIIDELSSAAEASLHLQVFTSFSKISRSIPQTN
jgi:hypothetical protein